MFCCILKPDCVTDLTSYKLKLNLSCIIMPPVQIEIPKCVIYVQSDLPNVVTCLMKSENSDPQMQVLLLMLEIMQTHHQN